VNDVFPLTTTETKLGWASVDSGGSVIVLVAVADHVVSGAFVTTTTVGLGAVAWLEGGTEAGFVGVGFPLDFSTMFDWVCGTAGLELGFTGALAGGDEGGETGAEVGFVEDGATFAVVLGGRLGLVAAGESIGGLGAVVAFVIPDVTCTGGAGTLSGAVSTGVADA